MTIASIAKEIPMSDNESELSQDDFMMKGTDQYRSNMAMFLINGVIIIIDILV